MWDRLIQECYEGHGKNPDLEANKNDVLPLSILDPVKPVKSKHHILPSTSKEVGEIYKHGDRPVQGENALLIESDSVRASVQTGDCDFGLTI